MSGKTNVSGQEGHDSGRCPNCKSPSRGKYCKVCDKYQRRLLEVAPLVIAQAWYDEGVYGGGKRSVLAELVTPLEKEYKIATREKIESIHSKADLDRFILYEVLTRSIRTYYGTKLTDEHLTQFGSELREAPDKIVSLPPPQPKRQRLTEEIVTVSYTGPTNKVKRLLDYIEQLDSQGEEGVVVQR